MEYIGIDVHQRECQVCILDSAGRVVLERRVGTREINGRFALAAPTSPPPFRTETAKLTSVGADDFDGINRDQLLKELPPRLKT